MANLYCATDYLGSNEIQTKGQVWAQPRHDAEFWSPQFGRAQQEDALHGNLELILVECEALYLINDLPPELAKCLH